MSKNPKDKTNRLTNIEPWPKGELAKAYKRIEGENWDAVEEAMCRNSTKRPGASGKELLAVFQSCPHPFPPPARFKGKV